MLTINLIFTLTGNSNQCFSISHRHNMVKITPKNINILFFLFFISTRNNDKKRLNKYEFEIINILEMAKIIYKDGKKDIFDAIYITKEGIQTGRIINNYEFINGGFIPKDNIKNIIGGIERKIHKRKSNF